MPKIIFVNPPLTMEERYGVKGKSGGETPPLGLAYLAAVTREEGYETEIFDACVENVGCKEAAEILLKKNPDYVGFTGATIAINKVQKIANILKKSNPKIRTLIGGAHFTALPRETLEKFTTVDVGVYGEGELTIKELLHEWENDRNFSAINGLVYRDNGNIIINPPRNRFKNLDELPYPAWDLFPDLANNYHPPVHTLKKFPAALLVTSRGCPHKCIFCDRSMFGNKVNFNSAEYIMRMVRDLYDNYGVREIQFRDDLFITNRKRILAFCDLLMADKEIDIAWTATGRVNIVDEELLKKMAEAGCWQIWYGVESGDDEILKTIKKNTNREMIKRAVDLTQNAGISACGFFILAHPTETKETIEKTIKFACELKLDEAHFGFMTPLPGSEMYKIADQYGTFENDWDKMTGWERPIFIPHDLTESELRTYSNMAFRKFYYRPRIVLNYLRKIRSMKHIKTYFSAFVTLFKYQLRNFKYAMKYRKNQPAAKK